MRNTGHSPRLLTLLTVMVFMMAFIAVNAGAQSPILLPAPPLGKTVFPDAAPPDDLLPHQSLLPLRFAHELSEALSSQKPAADVASVPFPAPLLLRPETVSLLQTTSAGFFAYPDFSDTDGLALVGDTAVVGDRLRLTSDAPCCQAGGVWHTSKQPVQAGFETSFSFEISSEHSETGDGLAFVIQNSPEGVAALGEGGCFIGYGGMRNALAIEFDTFRNAYYCYDIADLDDNHVSVQSGRQAEVYPYQSWPYTLATASAPVDLRAGVHTVRVVYRPGVLQVFIDEQLAVATAVDLSVLLALDNGSAWVGLVSGTGSFTQNHDLLNWSFRSDTLSTCGPDIDPNGWQTAAPLPQPMSTPFDWAGKELIVHDGRLYIFGGRAGESITHIYANELNPDGSPGAWITMTATLPGVYYEHSTIQVGEYIYFITGAADADDVFYAAIVDLDQFYPWQITHNPSGRQNFATAASDSYLYISGGDAGGPLDEVVFTSFNNGSLEPWQQTTPLPQPIQRHAMVIANDIIYILAPEPHNAVYYAAINPADGTLASWQTASIALPRPMLAMTAYVHNGYLYLLGGPNHFETDLYYSRIQPGGDLAEWAAATSLPTGMHREGMWAGGKGCTLYALGGHQPHSGDTGPYYADVYFATLQPQRPPATILLVEDAAPGSATAYTGALDTFGARYDVWQVSVNGEPDLPLLRAYDAVIWFTGSAGAGPSAATEAALSFWLNEAHKSLFISSATYHAQRGLTAFMTDYLGVLSVTDALAYDTVTADGPLGHFVSYSLLAATGANAAIHGAGSQETLFYTEDGAYHETAIGYDGGHYRATYWGFPFEALDSPDAPEIMRATLNWLAGEVRYGGPIDTGASSLSLDHVVAIARIDSVALSAWLVDEDGYPVIGRQLDIFGQGYETGQRYLGTAVSGENGALQFAFTWPTVEDVEIVLYDPAYQEELYFFESVTFFSGPPSPILSYFELSANSIPINVNGMDNVAIITGTLLATSGLPYTDPGYVELWTDEGYEGAWYTDPDGTVVVDFHRSYPTTLSTSLYSSSLYEAYGYPPIEVWWAGWISFVPGTIDETYSFTSAFPTERLADGIETALISASLADAYGNIVADRYLELWVSGDGGEQYVAGAITNEYGEISFDLAWSEVERLYPYLYDPLYEMYIYVDTNGDGVNFISGPIDLDHPDTIITIDPNPAYAGWSEVIVEAWLYTVSGHPAAARPLELYLNGSPFDYNYTDESGFVSFYLYPTETGEVSLELYDVDDGATIPIGTLTVLAGPVDLENSTVTAVPDLIAPDGVAASLLTAMLYDTAGNAVANREMQWIVDGNQSGWSELGSTVTDENGLLTYSLTWHTSEILEVIIYEALPGAEYEQYLYPGVFVNTTGAGAIDPLVSSLTVTPTEVLASGVHTAVISATLRDTVGTPVAERTIWLLVNDATHQIDSSDADGAISFALVSPLVQTMDVALFDPLYNTTISLGAVSFVAGPLNPGLSTLAANKTQITADTLDSATLTATLYDSYFHPLPGHSVLIQATGEDLTVIQPVTVTDSLGRVQATIQAGQPQLVTVTAYDQGSNTVLIETVELAFLPAPPVSANSDWSVTPAEVIADGLQLVIVSATLRDAINRPIANRPITLQVGGSNNTILPQATVNSGADGAVAFTLTSTRAQIKTLSLLDALTGASLSLGSVTFQPGPVNAVNGQVDIIGPSLARADGSDFITIQVTAYDAYLNPIPGVTVALTTTGNVTFTQPGLTDSNGRATGAVRSSQVGAFVVQARVNGVLLADSVTATFITAELVAGKSRSMQAYAGFPLTYTLSVLNTGLLTATNVIFTDTLPTGLSFAGQNSALPFSQSGQTLVWQAGDVAPGQSIVVSLVVTPEASLPDGLIVTNELVVTTSAVELNLDNNLATSRHSVKQPAPQLSIGPGHIKLEIAPDGSANATLIVRNTGLIGMSGISLAVPGTIPGLSVAPTTLPDLAPGQQASVNITVAPTATVPAGSYHDVLIVTEDSGGQQWALLSVTYLPLTRPLQLTITNDQGQPAPQAQVNMVMPNGLVYVVQGVTTWVNVTVGGTANSEGVLLLPAVPLGVYQYSAAAANHDPGSGAITVTAGSGTQTESISLVARPLLSVSPLSTAIAVAPGHTNAREIVITNRGAAPLTNVTVTPPLVYPWIYLGLPATLTSTLAPGESMRVSVYASPPASIPANIYNEYVMVSGSGQQQPVALTVNISPQNTRSLNVLVARELNGDSLANAQVILTRQETSLLVTQGITTTFNEQFVQRTNAGGQATFTDLPLGRYNYVVSLQGYKRDEGEIEVLLPDGGQGDLLFNKFISSKPPFVQTSPNQWLNILLYANPFDIYWNVQPTDDGYEILLNITRDTGAKEMEMFVPPREWKFTSCSGSLQDQIGIFNVSSQLITLEDIVIDVPGVSATVTSSPASLPPSSTGIIQVSATKVGELSQGTIAVTGTYQAVHTNTVSYTFNPSSFNSQNLLSGQTFEKAYELAPVLFDPAVAYTFVLTQPTDYEWMVLQTDTVSPVSLNAGTRLPFTLSVTPPTWLGEGVYEDRAAIAFTDPDKDLTRTGYLRIRLTKTEQGVLDLHTNFELGPTPTTDVPVTGKGDLIPRCEDDDGGGGGSGSGSGFGWIWGLLPNGILQGSWSGGGSGGGGGGGGNTGYWPPFSGTVGEMITIEGEANQEVRMEISQQMLLEGEGFQATLILNNRLAAETVNNVVVDLIITDEAGNPANALFDITPLPPTGLGDLPAGGEVGGQWLILPVNMNLTEANGRLFRVRAHMSYAVLGNQYSLNTVPRDFRVFPAPELIIDYELPYSEPGAVCTDFDMRATVYNVGAGPARNVRFNVQSLLIHDGEGGAPRSFEILEILLDDTPINAENLYMNVSLGVIPPGESRDIVWRLQPGSPGRFVEFTSDFRSLNYTGQSLTPRIREINTYINSNFAHGCTITPGPHSPDLIVEILPLPETIVVSETMNVEVRVTNLGTPIENADVIIRFAYYYLEMVDMIDPLTGNGYVEARWIELFVHNEPRILTLGQDESIPVIHQFTPPIFANYQLRVTVDPED